MSDFLPRSTLDAFQRLFYAARESARIAEGTGLRFVARMNGDTLKELGREVRGVVAPGGNVEWSLGRKRGLGL